MSYQLNENTSVTEEEIRDYVLRGNEEALTKEQINCIAYDYMNKVMRPNMIKWPKFLRIKLAEYGITQDPTTKLPVMSKSAQNLKDYCDSAVDDAANILSSISEITNKHSITTILDEFDSFKKEEPVEELFPSTCELEVEHLLKEIEFVKRQQTEVEQYADLLLIMMDKAGIEAPTYLDSKIKEERDKKEREQAPPE